MPSRKLSPEIAPNHLIDSLKAVRKKEFTDLARSLETAARLRRSSPGQRSYNEHELNEVNSHGYTRGQSLKGGFQNAIRRNREALQRHFGKTLPFMLQNEWHALVNQAMDAITGYGVNRSSLEDIVTLHGEPVRNENGLTNEEQEWYEIYKPVDFFSLSQHEAAQRAKHPELKRFD